MNFHMTVRYQQLCELQNQHANTDNDNMQAGGMFRVAKNYLESLLSPSHIVFECEHVFYVFVEQKTLRCY